MEMTPAIIIDIVIAAILVISMLTGCRKGLFLTLAGTAILILALVGAGFGSKTLSGPIAEKLTPIIRQHIAKTVEETLKENNQWDGETLADVLPDSLRRLLERTGLNEKLADALGQKAEGTIAQASSAVAAAIAKELVETLLSGILYVLLFIILLLLLWLTAHGINLVLQLPLLRGVNAFGGGIAGLVVGMLLVWALIWLAPKLGIALPTQDTYLLRFFSVFGPLRFLTSL